MKFVHYNNCVSPHQIPLAREIAAHIGADQFRYLYLDRELSERKAMGWSDEKDEWIVEATPENRKLLEDCDTLLTGVRDVALFQRRATKGLRTYYQSERWFKPIHGLLGCLRLLSPSYFKMARWFVKWVKDDPNARCLAIGPWAVKDFRFLGVPDDKLVKWGYFVVPTTLKGDLPNRCTPTPNGYPSKILWVGRMLRWKRVDTIIRAVRLLLAENRRFTLTIVGDGPEKNRLVGLAKGLPVTFLPSQPIGKIREIMREHDIYVLASNAEEGWGAALNEALEEGMRAVGTYEAGSSATILPDTVLYHAGDYRGLARCLESSVPRIPIGEWSAKRAAERLLNDSV